MIAPLIIAALVGGTIAVSYAMSAQAQKKAEKAAQDGMGVLINRVGLSEQIPVIYGTRRTGGVRVFATTGEGASADLPNDELYMALVVSEGEVESITDLHVDGEPYIGSKYANWLSWWAYTGSDSQAASSFLISNSDGKWTSNHKLSGLAYIVVKLRMTEIQRKNVWSGLPELTVLVKGRKVYDPRTATTAWSDNPALCIRDYLTNTRYGKGIPASDIDDTLFISAANTLDQTYVLVDGEPADKPYRCNAVMEADRKLIDNFGDLLLGCKGFLPYSNGKYGLVIDDTRSSSFSFNADNIIKGVKVDGLDKSNKFNQVVVSFPNALSDYQDDEVVYPVVDSTEDIAWLAEDNGERLKDDVTMPTITSRSAAFNIAKTLLIRSRNNTRVSFNATSEALNLTVGDVCDITYGSLGWVAKEFKVENITLNNDGTCGITAREYIASAYSLSPIANDPTYPDAALPDPFIVRAPTNLQVSESSTIANDGTLVSALAVEWVESTDGFVSSYELQWKKTTDLEYNSVSIVSNKYLITGVETGANYDIRVRALNGFGSSSDFLGGTSGGLVGDSTAPAIPTSVVATGGLGEITLSWVKPNDFDYSHCQVYENTANNFSTATLIANASQDRFTRTGLDYDVTRYYWLKSVDYSGNASAQTASVNATTLFVDSDAFSQAVFDLIDDAGNVQPVGSLPATGFDGDIVFLTTNSALYRWDTATSAWVPAVESVSILDGSITSGKIANAAVTGNKIATSAITGTLIAPSTITGSNIANSAITGSLIASGTITGNLVAANTIAAGNIVSNTITGNQIAGSTITGDLVAANTIAAGNIASNTITANEIASSTITGDLVAANTLSGDKIAGNTITGNKIVANTITGGLLATAGIITNSAQIDNLVVTGAKIANAAVDTIKIAGQAVTIPTHVYVETGPSFASGTWTEVISATYTSTGNPTMVSFSAIVLTNSNGWDRMDARVYRNGTLIRDIYRFASVNNANVQRAAGVVLQDTPPAGTVTYSIQLYRVDSSYKPENDLSLFILETKR